MDKSHKDIQINTSKQEINSDNKDTIILPIINKESIPIQNNISVNNNIMNHYIKCNIPKINKNAPAFLTMKKIETGKNNNLDRSKYNKSKTNNSIIKLLKEKIEINNKRNAVQQTHKNLENKLKIYMDDASLYKNSHFIHREKKKIKQVKLGKLFTLSNKNKSKYIIDTDRNENTIDLRLYKNRYEDRPKIYKSLDKQYIKNEKSECFRNNWRKNLNCGLKYKYNKNKESIDNITLKIQKIDNIVKETFIGFKNEAEDIFNEIIDTQRNTKYNII